MHKITTHWVLSVLVTVIVLTYNLLHPSETVHMTSLIALSVLWIAVSFKNQKTKLDHNLIVERVDKLKSFSVELQSLINKELVLVQDDVVRTKKIIGDSIGMLQSSVKEINENMQQQKNYLDELIASNSHSMDEADIEINDHMSDRSTDKVSQLNVINSKNKSNMDNMMIALQFEDIVNQISDRVAQHISDIRSTVDILSKLCESELSNTFQDDIQRMEDEYKEIKEKLLKVSSKNLAAQENMNEGEIDLF